MKIISYTLRKLPIGEDYNKNNKKGPSSPEISQDISKKKGFLSKEIWISLVIILGLGILSVIGIIIYKELKKKKKTQDPQTYLNNLIINSLLKKKMMEYQLLI